MNDPAARGGTRKVVAGLFGAGATLLLLLIAILAWTYSVFLGPGPAARQGDETLVTFRSGAGVTEIGAQLRSAGVIRSADAFRAAVKFSRADRRLRAGEYRFASRASLSKVVETLKSGEVVRHFVTLPEGRSVAQAVDLLKANPLLTGDIVVPDEGTLWPETYEVSRGESRQAVIDRMREAADKGLAEAWAGREPGLPLQTPREALILASIVEKETGVAAERPRVAAVFINRLRQGMRLETDPTVAYPITLGRPMGRGLRLSELQRDTPYNSYLHAGLPPGPIANPGRAALTAVLHPAHTNELFFVADGSGGHVFASDFQAHLANVAKWRGIERARAEAATGAGATAGAMPPSPTQPPAPGLPESELRAPTN